MNKPKITNLNKFTSHDGSDEFYDDLEKLGSIVELYESTKFHEPINSESLTFHYLYNHEVRESEGIEIKYINEYFEDETSLDDGHNKITRYYRVMK